ncbi:MAG: DNA repair protein RadC [Holophagales bacterium]|jgi:DNA repair protein RadC|nr:DNA repair protein RadC [Holophagales bacterium]
MKMTDIAPEQRPRERLFAGLGEELSDADILALIWGSGQKGRSVVEMGQEILSITGGLSGLMSLGLKELSDLPGLGPAKVGQLWAVQEIARRSKRGHSKIKINSPRKAGDYLLARCTGWTEEHFGLLALNSKCELIAERILSKGTAIGTMVTPREFFREALRYGAVTAIAYHNHPSGSTEPSREDAMLTEKLRNAGESLGLKLVDHIIVGSSEYYSFRTSEEWDI